MILILRSRTFYLHRIWYLWRFPESEALQNVVSATPLVLFSTRSRIVDELKFVGLGMGIRKSIFNYLRDCNCFRDFQLFREFEIIFG